MLSLGIQTPQVVRNEEGNGQDISENVWCVYLLKNSNKLLKMTASSYINHLTVLRHIQVGLYQ